MSAVASGVFLGLSALTVTMLRAGGLVLGWVDFGRGILLLVASLWSLRLAWLIAKRYSVSTMRQALAASSVALALTVADAAWVFLFWIW
jgi:hypothetical protein